MVVHGSRCSPCSSIRSSNGNSCCSSSIICSSGSSVMKIFVAVETVMEVGVVVVVVFVTVVVSLYPSLIFPHPQPSVLLFHG